MMGKRPLLLFAVLFVHIQSGLLRPDVEQSSPMQLIDDNVNKTIIDDSHELHEQEPQQLQPQPPQEPPKPLEQQLEPEQKPQEPEPPKPQEPEPPKPQKSLEQPEKSLEQPEKSLERTEISLEPEHKPQLEHEKQAEPQPEPESKKPELSPEKKPELSPEKKPELSPEKKPELSPEKKPELSLEPTGQEDEQQRVARRILEDETTTAPLDEEERVVLNEFEKLINTLANVSPAKMTAITSSMVLFMSFVSICINFVFLLIFKLNRRLRKSLLGTFYADLRRSFTSSDEMPLQRIL